MHEHAHQWHDYQSDFRDFQILFRYPEQDFQQHPQLYPDHRGFLQETKSDNVRRCLIFCGKKTLKMVSKSSNSHGTLYTSPTYMYDCMLCWVRVTLPLANLTSSLIPVSATSTISSPTWIAVFGIVDSKKFGMSFSKKSVKSPWKNWIVSVKKLLHWSSPL